MPSSKPKIIPVESPWDTWLFAFTSERSQDVRFHEAMSVKMKVPTRRLSREELIELSCRAIELLSPRFSAVEFLELIRRLGAGPKFKPSDAARLLRHLCEEPVLEIARRPTPKQVAVYRVRSRPRSR